jgi:putative ubiquitin-RnfH superfamily antitoxin RatB of RatAB toxin-antitoxin module
MKIQSEKYKNITYSVHVRQSTPEKGTLRPLLLKPAASVSCQIKADTLMTDCSDISITVAYKQIISKAARNKTRLSKMDASEVFYRSNLNTLITNFKKPLGPFEEGKALLLNDLSSIKDRQIGDTAIQPMFYFTKLNGSNEFILCPGAPLEQLSLTVGMSIFEASSIEEVLDSMVFNMSTLLVDNVLPMSGLDMTPALLTDIQRYLHFHFYGD